MEADCSVVSVIAPRVSGGFQLLTTMNAAVLALRENRAVLDFGSTRLRLLRPENSRHSIKINEAVDNWV